MRNRSKRENSKRKEKGKKKARAVTLSTRLGFLACKETITIFKRRRKRGGGKAVFRYTFHGPFKEELRCAGQEEEGNVSLRGPLSLLTCPALLLPVLRPCNSPVNHLYSISSINYFYLYYNLASYLSTISTI